MTEPVPCCFGCTRRGHHTPTCQDHDTCTGCAPRPGTIGAYCTHHHDKVLDALLDLPDLTTLVALMPGGHTAAPTSSSDHTRRPTKVDQASPSPAWDAADEITTWAHAWAETVADTLGHAGPTRATVIALPHYDLTATTTYLRAQLERIATNPDIAHDFATETINHRKALQLMTGTDRLIHRLRAACPSCDQRTLTREDGADQVACQNVDCRRVWTELEYANLAHVAAS